MSISGRRAAFQQALTAVDGVQAFSNRVVAPRAGDAWPVWRGGTREDGLFVFSWDVVVTLPADERTAETWVQEHLGVLLAAVGPVAYVDGFTIANLSPDGQQYALVLTTRSE